jgi:hypothetical protein
MAPNTAAIPGRPESNPNWKPDRTDGQREFWVSRSEKLGRGGTDDELAKPLIVIQRV